MILSSGKVLKCVIIYNIITNLCILHLSMCNNVPKRCVRSLYTYNMNSGETELGPDSRQVPTSFSKTFIKLKDHVIQLNKFKLI